MTFSVVIPTRNRAEQLKRALASVKAQTDQDFEIIVVDDGSEPAEASEIAELVARTPKASLIRNDTSLGAPLARNAGVAASRGEVIALLDSDDWWAPGRLAAHRAALSREANAVLVYNVAEFVDTNGKSQGLTNASPPDPGTSPAAAVAGSNFLGGCSSVCVGRKAFDAVGGFSPDLPSCQDWDLWFRIAARGGRIEFIDEVLTLQDCGSHERISNQRDRVEAGHQLVMDEILRVNWSRADERFIRARHDEVRAWIAHSFGEDLTALYFILKSLGRQPSARTHSIAKDYLKRLVGRVRTWRS